jgi:hypothetical protein
MVLHRIGRLHSDDGRAMSSALQKLTSAIVAQLPGSETAAGPK